MKKVLSSSIFALIIIVAAIGVGIAIGVTATTNAQKSMEFSVSVKNEPAFNLVVNLNVTTTSGTTTTKIFDSRNQTTVVKTFIDSITTDTINLDSAKIFENPNVTAASLDVYNYTENVKISVAVNSSENPLLLADYNGTEDPTPTNVPIESGSLGITITSLKFEIASFKTFATLNADGVFTVDASPTGEPASGTTYVEKYTDLDSANYTSGVISNTNSAPWLRDGNWASITKVVFTGNVSNPDLNISYWFCGDADDEEAYPITSVEFAKNTKLKTIGARAFSDCSSLTSITIPSSVTTIDDYAFYYCKLLESVEFSENSQVITIDTCAFARCYKLDNINIPSSVNEIGGSAFHNCSSLTSVTFEDATTWYLADTADHKFTGGTEITYDLSDKGIAATCLKDTYVYDYWYKL